MCAVCQAQEGSVVMLGCNDLNYYFMVLSVVGAVKGGLSLARKCSFGVVAKAHSRRINLYVAHLVNIGDMHGVAGTARVNLKLYPVC